MYYHTKYVVGAEQQKTSYWWGGPRLGPTSILDSAIGYASAEVALMAAEVVDARIRKDWPNALKIRAIRVTYHYEPSAWLSEPGLQIIDSGEVLESNCESWT